MEALLDPQNVVSLLTLTLLEIVLGIDNIIFLTILTGRLPREKQALARRVGLFGAMFMRIGLLITLSWMMRLTRPLFTVLGNGISGRDLILILGGIFLVGKATHEIYERLEVATEEDEHGKRGPRAAGFAGVIVQVMLLDIVFSIDSVIAAVGMSRHVAVMIAAIVVAVGLMMFFAGPIGDFIERHPSMKVLALSFLIMIGVFLVADGLGQHVSKGYIYSAMAFSLFVEFVNMKVRKAQQKPVQLHHPFSDEPPPPTGTGTSKQLA